MIRYTYSIKTISRALSITLGAFLISYAHAGNEIQLPCPSPTLALELFEESDWKACRIECARSLASHSIPKLKLLHAVSGLRLGIDAKPELVNLCDDPHAPTSLAAIAHYELGRAYWIEDNHNEAFTHLKKSFLSESTVETHQLSGCTLYLLLEENPKLATSASGLKTILATCSDEWDRDLFNECRKPKKNKKNVSTAPARWLILFYQKQIGPAIGDRCTLHPSCSRYAMQALKTHGIIGAGAMGDRFIREPDVVKHQCNPVKINKHIRYSDPLSDHDWWIKK